MKGKKYLEELLSNKFVIEEYKNEINEYVDNLEQQVKKQKEAINKIQMVVIDMQTELMKLQPYHSYVIDGNKVRNFTEDFEDILKEVSDE
jgi:flagellar biosynthesis chaperone FliJ